MKYWWSIAPWIYSWVCMWSDADQFYCGSTVAPPCEVMLNCFTLDVELILTVKWCWSHYSGSNNWASLWSDAAHFNMNPQENLSVMWCWFVHCGSLVEPQYDIILISFNVDATFESPCEGILIWFNVDLELSLADKWCRSVLSGSTVEPLCEVMPIYSLWIYSWATQRSYADLIPYGS